MPTSTAAELPFNQMARQASKLMDQMQKGFYVYSGETWTPSVNLYETAGSYIVCVDLAGVDKQKIEVEVIDQRLRLRGSRSVPSLDESIAAGETGPDSSASADPGAPAQGGHESHGESRPAPAPEAESAPRRVRIHLMEIDHGAFSREVELPMNVDRERITANYRNGLLWIELPKA